MGNLEGMGWEKECNLSREGSGSIHISFHSLFLATEPRVYTDWHTHTLPHILSRNLLPDPVYPVGASKNCWARLSYITLMCTHISGTPVSWGICFIKHIKRSTPRTAPWRIKQYLHGRNLKEHPLGLESQVFLWERHHSKRYGFLPYKYYKCCRWEVSMWHMPSKAHVMKSHRCLGNPGITYSIVVCYPLHLFEVICLGQQTQPLGVELATGRVEGLPVIFA